MSPIFIFTLSFLTAVYITVTVHYSKSSSVRWSDSLLNTSFSSFFLFFFFFLGGGVYSSFFFFSIYISSFLLRLRFFHFTSSFFLLLVFSFYFHSSSSVLFLLLSSCFSSASLFLFSSYCSYSFLYPFFFFLLRLVRLFIHTSPFLYSPLGPFSLLPFVNPYSSSVLFPLRLSLLLSFELIILPVHIPSNP